MCTLADTDTVPMLQSMDIRCYVAGEKSIFSPSQQAWYIWHIGWPLYDSV